MPLNIKELRQRKADLVGEGKALIGAAADGRLTDEQKTRDDAIVAELAEVDDTIARAERQMERERSLPAQNDGDATAAPQNRPGDERPAFGSFGEQLQAVFRAAQGDRDARLVWAATGANEGSPSEGGFLVQVEHSTELLRRMYEMGEVARRVRRIPLSNPAASGLKIPGIDETSRANGSRWGGIRAYWTGEAAEFTASQPKFRQIELDLKKLTGLCYATEELLADTSALEQIISDGFAEEFTFKVEDAVVNGSGAGMPLGILNAGCTVSVAKETGQAAATLTFENVSKMWSRMWGRSRQDAVWLINQDIEPQLYGLSVVVGTGGVPVYLPPGGLSQSPYATLMGRPVIPVEYCATLGTVGDIVLADFSQYVMVDKGAPKQASSVHVRFIYDEMTYRFTYRADGQPSWHSALTPFKGTATKSPFVTLATRA